MPGSYVPENYLPILLFMILAVGMGFGLLLLGEIIRPRRPYREKLMPYESGSTFETGVTPLVEPTRYRFSVRFYIIAMLFVVFDVEAIFLYPWAIVFDRIGLFAFIEMVIFIVILLIGFVYAWRKEAFKWD
ncbi:MAG TPA: NADH-quinone oxidoreductase subunit A [Dissulfurispiraceae bacterium]|jgi:NADH-quinone oxidoreductase subunit A|nr:NADH-quinone oxidoreductase subunit A [Dissulfurispiraceae bacterium]